MLCDVTDRIGKSDGVPLSQNYSMQSYTTQYYLKAARITKRSLIVFISLIAANQVQAQKQITHQSGYWARYYGKAKLDKKWELDLELEDRRFFKDNRQLNYVLPRLTALYELGEGWTAGVGFTYYLSANPADQNAPVGVTVPELRPHQELDYKQKIGKFGISHRFKFEERFVHKSNATELLDGYTFSGRFRYQLQLSYPLISSGSEAGSLVAKAADEILLNTGHSIVANTFDQNRIYFGLNYGLSKQFQVELGYLNWFQERSSGTQYYDRNIARLTIYHSLNFSKN